jgi:hypothetical protein
VREREEVIASAPSSQLENVRSSPVTEIVTRPINGEKS